jgi:hypothetical protein
VLLLVACACDGDRERAARELAAAEAAQRALVGHDDQVRSEAESEAVAARRARAEAWLAEAELDLSDDESVARHVRAHAGGDPTGDLGRDALRCIRRPSFSTEIVLVGRFAHDAGCGFRGVFVGDRFFQDRREAAEVALKQTSFLTAEVEAREQLALEVVADVLYAYREVVSRDSDVTTGGDIAVTVATRRPSRRGGQPRPSTTHRHVVTTDGHIQ